MNYFDELKKSMEWLAEKPETLFLGQAVAYSGTGMSTTLKDVKKEKLIELPVLEDFQGGLVNGLALNNFIPISIYPRWNFLILALNQIVNHLDKIPIISNYRPKVIIRTGIGSKFPLNPQLQHVGDFTEAVQKMVSNIEVIRLDSAEMIFESYKKAYERKDGKSTILVEWSDAYNPEFKIEDYYKN